MEIHLANFVMTGNIAFPPCGRTTSSIGGRAFRGANRANAAQRIAGRAGDPQDSRNRVAQPNPAPGDLIWSLPRHYRSNLTGQQGGHRYRERRHRKYQREILHPLPPLLAYPCVVPLMLTLPVEVFLFRSWFHVSCPFRTFQGHGSCHAPVVRAGDCIFLCCRSNRKSLYSMSSSC